MVNGRCCAHDFFEISKKHRYLYWWANYGIYEIYCTNATMNGKWALLRSRFFGDRQNTPIKRFVDQFWRFRNFSYKRNYEW